MPLILPLPARGEGKEGAWLAPSKHEWDAWMFCRLVWAAAPAAGRLRHAPAAPGMAALVRPDELGAYALIHRAWSMAVLGRRAPSKAGPRKS